MAIKRYPVRYIKTYHYTDETTGESEDIVFMANGYLFPLFKSLTGVELTVALDEYKKGLMEIVTAENMQALYKLQEADDADAKLDVAMDNQEALLNMLKVASDTKRYGDAGLDLIELIMICTRICALPQSDHAEALGAGTEILPEEVYQDPELAFELLKLATAYDDNAKKNSKVSRSFTERNAPPKP